MFCINCNKETNNPKFCSRSCSVAFHNKGVCKNGLKGTGKVIFCRLCGKQTVKNDRNYCSPQCYYKDKWNLWKIKVEKDGVFFPSTKYNTAALNVKKYLMEKHGEKCSICGQLPLWNDKPLVLILDHINGIANDWSISNFRLVCPNCDTQLPTFKGRNKNGVRKYRLNFPKLGA